MIPVGRVSQFVREINHASNEQLLGISQVNQAVSSLDGITQQNAAAVEQIAAASSSLASTSSPTTDWTFPNRRARRHGRPVPS